MKFLYVIFTVKHLNFSKTLSIIKKNKMFVVKAEKNEEQAHFRVFFWNKNRAIKILQNANVDFVVQDKGYQFFSNGLRKNAGFLAAIFMSLAIIPIYSSFIFDVKIIGATEISQSKIESFVASKNILPISIKSRVTKIDLQNELLNWTPELSFSSFMIKGTTLFISVKEKLVPDEMNSASFLALRAPSNGIVEEFELFQGTAAVRKGSFVMEGEALVMPYVITNLGEKKDVIPKAEILIRCFAVQTYTHFENREEIVRTGKKIVQRTIAIWGKEVYHSNESNKFGSFETIIKDQKLSLGNLLPIRMISNEIYETTKIVVNEPFENVKTGIFEKLKQKCNEIIESGTIKLNEFQTEERTSSSIKATYVIEYEKRIGTDENLL